MGFPLPRFGTDGDFEKETVSAVRNYQSAKGLIADGIVGPITIKSLEAQFAS
ncbi:MAG: peptidoglycan-binding protein [Methanosarcinales archaeon]|nr:peptidoglycan-binding protein [Methanosarcinales archaeon]